MAANNEAQMVLGHDNSIIVSNGQQSPDISSAVFTQVSSDYHLILHWVSKISLLQLILISNHWILLFCHIRLLTTSRQAKWSVLWGELN